MTTKLGGDRTTRVVSGQASLGGDAVVASDTVAGNGAGSYVMSVAADGPTRAFAVDRVTTSSGCTASCVYTVSGGDVFTTAGGSPHPVPSAGAAVMIALSGTELALVRPDRAPSRVARPHDAPGDTVAVADDATGAAISTFKPRGRVLSVGISGPRVAMLMQRDGGKHIQVRDTGSGAVIGAWRVSRATSDVLAVSGDWVVYHQQHTIWALDSQTGLRREVIQPPRNPVGLALNHQRLSWAANATGKTLLHVRRVPNPPGTEPFPQRFNDTYRGWPVAPVHRAHGVYGSFLNPTCGCPSPFQPMEPMVVAVFHGYHGGIDIPVNDSRPEPGHPPHRSHRVYAVEGGRVIQAGPTTRPCKGRRVRIGHFGYGHVDPTVDRGQMATPGQMIGWTCMGRWHVHLSEWLLPPGGGRIRVNPLRPGGKLSPIVDPGKPTIATIRLYGDGRRISPRHVHGIIQPIARAQDSFPYTSWPGAPRAGLDVYAMTVTLRRLPSMALVTSRYAFRSRTEPAPQKSYYYLPLTTRNVDVRDCATHHLPSCDPRYWLRLWPHGLNTRNLPAGRYLITVQVADTVAHVVARSLTIHIIH